MELAGLAELQRELRTREALGEGTDVRLVLIEAATVSALLEQLKIWIADPMVTGAALERLDDEWAALDLEEVTVRMREVADLLELLLYAGGRDRRHRSRRRRHPRGPRT